MSAEAFRFTPSAGPRLSRCLGSACLPQVVEEWESSERGTALHRYLEGRGRGRTLSEALAAVPEEWRAEAERLEVPEDVASGSPEVALALHLERGQARVLGERLTREAARQAAKEGEVPMVVDWVALAGAQGAVLRDWKTGWQEHLMPAREHLQLRTYAASVLLAYGLEEVRAELWHWDGVRWWVDATTVDWLEAERVLEEVRALLAMAHSARAAYQREGVLPRLAVGAWCSWCPSRRYCPAVAGPAAAMLGWPANRPLELSPEAAGQAWELLRQLEAWVEERKADLQRLASASPLPLPSGLELRLQEVVTQRVEVEAALPVLAARFGEELAQAAVREVRTMPWEWLREALRQHALPTRLAQAHEGRKPTLAALEREARQALVAAGAVKVSTHPRLCARPAGLPPGGEEGGE